MATNKFNQSIKVYFKWDIPKDIDTPELREELRDVALERAFDMGAAGYTCGELHHCRGKNISGWWDTEVADEADD